LTKRNVSQAKSRYASVARAQRNVATADFDPPRLRQSLKKTPDYDENEEIDLSLRGWKAMCPADSPMGLELGNTPAAYDPSNGTRSTYTFIADHYRSMDLCDHPEIVPLHGSLLEKDPAASELAPLFVLSKTTLHSDILGVPVEQLVTGMRDVPWEEKFEDRLLWKGSNTGTYYWKGTSWRDTQRTRLLKLTNDAKGEVEMLSPPKVMNGRSISQGLKKVPIGEANAFYHDLAFTGQPIRELRRCACNEPKAAIQLMQR
jgi:hypothetical protein